MSKKIHVHVHANAPTGTTKDSDDTGRWVTINGAHVHIGEKGQIDKGPAELVGKTENGAHSAHHQGKSKEHLGHAQAKGPEHPDTKSHNDAGHHHALASRHYADADFHEGHGDIKSARASREKADKHAALAEKHSANVGNPGNKPGEKPAPFEKPKAHLALHGAAEEDVKGSEKHEAEHKRLMGLYDSSKADWERQAANRLIEKNGTDAVQHKAQRLHHHALAASEYAKGRPEVEHHEDALKKIDAAIDAHGKAGGVGYAAKQDELRKARKEHAKVVENANKALAKAGAPGRYNQGKGSPYEESKDHGALESAHRSTAKALRAMGQHKDADKHEAAADFHKKAAASGHPQDSEDAHTATRMAGAPMKAPAAKEPAPKPQRKASGSGGTPALDKVAARVANRAGEEGADQDPKHKK